MNKSFEIYKHKNEVIAIVIRSNFKGKDMRFFTEDSSSQQLAFISHKKGKIIEPHRHNKIKREIYYTQEVDILKKGKIKVYLYTKNGEFFKNVILNSGDLILFASGGHGYRVIRDIEMILVKQGPYAGDKDKTYIDDDL